MDRFQADTVRLELLGNLRICGAIIDIDESRPPHSHQRLNLPFNLYCECGMRIAEWKGPSPRSFVKFQINLLEIWLGIQSAIRNLQSGR
jgi:hypothetical protein